MSDNHVTYDIPAARAILRDVRVTPTKARRVVDLIRGRSVNDAQAILSFAPQAAAEPVLKLLKSAVANAEGRLGESADALSVYRAFVDEGQTWKRIRPRSRSQAFRILKRSSHITLVVASTEAAAAAAGRPVTSNAARARLSNARTSSKAAASKTSTAKKTSSKSEKVNS
jgi:large subunit ribosomal protein L22